jgi:predicted transcriptional regulator
MKQKSSTPQSRWAKRSLKQQLLYKFINEYGYEQGPVVASAIVDDLLILIDEVYSDHLPPRYINWPAVPVRNGSQGKSPDIHLLVNVRLQMVTDQEVAILNDQKLLGQQAAKRTFNQHRFARWCQEAYAQDGVLTLFDLSLLSGLGEGQVGYLLRQYQEEHQTTLPLRGTVHDIGPAVSHKAEVIRRFLQGQSPADIARELNHTQQAVDIYLKDYEVTRKLIQKFPIKDVPVLSRRSMSLVKEHVKLIRQYEPDLVFFSANGNSASKNLSQVASPTGDVQTELHQ